MYIHESLPVQPDVESSQKGFKWEKLALTFVLYSTFF